ncbi:hypothetical protein SeMB42_g00427 [Synchytrium endobioticum]|nr:hypothetical protein SeMB42_g00427 [Synchytrium endobioticum]
MENPDDGLLPSPKGTSDAMRTSHVPLTQEPKTSMEHRNEVALGRPGIGRSGGPSHASGNESKAPYIGSRRLKKD